MLNGFCLNQCFPGLQTVVDPHLSPRILFNAMLYVVRGGMGRDFLLRDVVRATSASPTYFEPANISALDRKVYPLVDGGVFANNPTMCACVEAFGMDSKLKIADLKALSLGTGAADKPYHYSEAKNWGKTAAGTRKRRGIMELFGMVTPHGARGFVAYHHMMRNERLFHRGGSDLMLH